MKQIILDIDNSRRSVMAGSAALASVMLCSNAMPLDRLQSGINPDAELIQLCEEFCALEHQILAFYAEGATPIEDDDERDVVQQPFIDRQEALVCEIFNIRAKTAAGHKARAKLYRLWSPDNFNEDHFSHWGDYLIAALVRDMVGEQ